MPTTRMNTPHTRACYRNAPNIGTNKHPQIHPPHQKQTPHTNRGPHPTPPSIQKTKVLQKSVLILGSMQFSSFFKKRG